MKLYEKLADEIEETVRRGVFAPGEKIASVRQASPQHEVSIKTVLHAYALLESRGILETRPQSGYFVRVKPLLSASSHASSGRVIATASEVDVSRLVLSTLCSIRAHDAVPFGSPYPDPEPFPWRRITSTRMQLRGGSRAGISSMTCRPAIPNSFAKSRGAMRRTACRWIRKKS